VRQSIHSFIESEVWIIINITCPLLLLLDGGLGVLPSFGSVAAQLRHPPDILIDITFANHVHYLASILLNMLVLKLFGEALVGLPEEVIGRRVLHLW